MQAFPLKCGRIAYVLLVLFAARGLFGQVPTFTVQPSSRTAQVGQPTVTSVTATGDAPISYQWYKNGGIVASATNSTYSWSNPSFTDAGTYYAIASNSSGSTPSADMTLTVTCPQGGANDFQFVGTVTKESSHGAPVACAALVSNGNIYVGGNFIGFNGVALSRIARLHADGTLDPTFMNGQSGANDSVECLAVQPDGKVVVGGYFTSVNGTNQNRIARLNVNGTLDTTFSCQVNGAGAINRITAGVLNIALQTNGQMIVCGVLTNINDTLLTNIARINADGSVDSTFKASVTGAYVYSVLLQGDGKVLVAGSFTNVNGVARTNFARLNSDGTLDDLFQGFVGTTDPNSNSGVSVFVENSGKILLSGSFTNIDGVARYHLARLNSDGSLDADVWNGGVGDDDNPNFGVAGITALGQPDGKVFMYGNFSHVNGVARRGLARLNVDGSVDDTFQNGMIGNPDQNLSGGFVTGAVIQPDGKILLVGRMTSMNGFPENGIVRLWGNQPACVESTSVQGDGTINLTVRATPGVTNRLQFKDGITDPSWTDLPVDIVGTDPSTTTNVVDTPNGNGERFYQLRQLP